MVTMGQSKLMTGVQIEGTATAASRLNWCFLSTIQSATVTLGRHHCAWGCVILDACIFWGLGAALVLNGKVSRDFR